MLIAETGGLNAMLVDSTALPEQAVRDVLASAFQSAGQRCSALRILYVQTDVEHKIMEMLKGAMAELVVGDPALLSTDVGPVIDAEAQASISAYCAGMEAQGRLVARLDAPGEGRFVAPPHPARLRHRRPGARGLRPGPARPGAPAALQPLLGKGVPVAALDGTVAPEELTHLAIDVVASAAEPVRQRALRQGLAARAGPIVPLITEPLLPAAYAQERAVCVDTTAAGGNAILLAAA